MKKATIAALLLSLVLIGVGVFRTEPSTVLSKGINICLECVGIG